MQNKRNDHGVVGRKEFVKWHNYIICSTKLMLDVESNQNLFPISVCVSIQKNPTVDLGQHSFDSPATLIRLGFHAIRIFGGQASQPFPTNRLRMQVILCPFGWIKPIDKNGRIYRGTPKTGKNCRFWLWWGLVWVCAMAASITTFTTCNCMKMSLWENAARWRIKNSWDLK